MIARNTTFTFRLPSSLKEEVEEIARLADVTRADVAIRFLREGIANYKAQLEEAKAKAKK